MRTCSEATEKVANNKGPWIYSTHHILKNDKKYNILQYSKNLR